MQPSFRQFECGGLQSNVCTPPAEGGGLPCLFLHWVLARKLPSHHPLFSPTRYFLLQKVFFFFFCRRFLPGFLGSLSPTPPVSLLGSLTALRKTNKQTANLSKHPFSKPPCKFREMQVLILASQFANICLHLCFLPYQMRRLINQLKM